MQTRITLCGSLRTPGAGQATHAEPWGQRWPVGVLPVPGWQMPLPRLSSAAEPSSAQPAAGRCQLGTPPRCCHPPKCCSRGGRWRRWSGSCRATGRSFNSGWSAWRSAGSSWPGGKSSTATPSSDLTPTSRQWRPGGSGSCAGRARSGRGRRRSERRLPGCGGSWRGCCSAGSAWPSACGASGPSGTTCGPCWPRWGSSRMCRPCWLISGCWRSCGQSWLGRQKPGRSGWPRAGHGSSGTDRRAARSSWAPRTSWPGSRHAWRLLAKTCSTGSPAGPTSRAQPPRRACCYGRSSWLC